MSLKTYIVHVKNAYEREKHIKAQLEGKDLDIEFVLDGDIPDLTPEIIDKYFTGKRALGNSKTSCAYKHILAQQAMIRDEVPIALVLEDDAVLYANWDEGLELIMDEISVRGLNNYMISLEDSSLRYPGGSEIAEGIYLYQRTAMRTSGAYLLDLQCAHTIIGNIEHLRMDRGMGQYPNIIAKEGRLSIYWAHPPVVVQGTATGLFKTTVSKNKTGLWGRLSWVLQRAYKRLLYRSR